MSRIPDLKPAEQSYVSENYGSKPVQDMATHLKRGPATIYAWMKARGLQPFKSVRMATPDHPFRYMNIKLATTLRGHRIANSTRQTRGQNYRHGTPD